MAPIVACAWPSCSSRPRSQTSLSTSPRFVRRRLQGMCSHVVPPRFLPSGFSHLPQFDTGRISFRKQDSKISIKYGILFSIITNRESAYVMCFCVVVSYNRLQSRHECNHCESKKAFKINLIRCTRKWRKK